MTPERLPPLPWLLLAACCFGVFTASCSGSTRAPFLIDMANDLSVSVPLVANLVAITSISWGIASLLAGAGSARWGRRPFLVGGDWPRFASSKSAASRFEARMVQFLPACSFGAGRCRCA